MLDRLNDRINELKQCTDEDSLNVFNLLIGFRLGLTKTFSDKDIARFKNTVKYSEEDFAVQFHKGILKGINSN